MTPTKAFVTKGVGKHKEKLSSFELALRDAGIAQFNLVKVSSIFPPGCQLVTRKQGLTMLSPGQIAFVVMSENSTNEPSRLIAASTGLAIPKDKTHYGYISEAPQLRAEGDPGGRIRRGSCRLHARHHP